MTGGGEIQIARAIRGGAPERDDEELRREDVATAELVARIQAGESDLFAELYERYFDRVYAYLRVMLRSSHEAEDAAQEVFVKVFQSLEKYESRGRPVRAWLFTIARNHSIEKLRRAKRLEVTDPADLDRKREDHDGQERWVLGWISDRDLMLFVERLPLAQRQVLVLRFMMELSTKEIAEVLERTEVDIRGLQHRALAFLRDRLAAVGRDSRGQRARTVRRLRQAPVLRFRRFALRAP
jgi:RNA polymerase sigma-70 factor (ECF subfamily)